MFLDARLVDGLLPPIVCLLDWLDDSWGIAEGDSALFLRGNPAARRGGGRGSLREACAILQPGVPHGPARRGALRAAALGASTHVAF